MILNLFSPRSLFSLFSICIFLSLPILFLSSREGEAQTQPAQPPQAENPSPQAPSAGPLDHLQKGTQALFSGNLDLAESEFLAAISQNPLFHRAHFGLGLVYLQKNLPDLAENSFRKAVEIEPNYAPAYRGLGQVYELEKKIPEAILNYQKAVSLEKVNPAFANDVAIARFRLSQIGETEEIAQKIREHYQKGTNFLKARNEGEALKEFLQVLDLAPRKLDALENAGTIYFNQGKLPEASEYLRRIIAIDPNILFAHYLLGLIAEAGGNIGEAWDEMSAIVKIGGKIPGQKDVERAKELIEQWGPTRESASEAYERLKKGDLLYQKGDLAGAEGEYQAILQKIPSHIRAKYGLALIDYKKGNFTDAKKILVEVVEKDPKLLLGHLILGKLYLRENAIQNAFLEISKVVELGKQPVIEQEFHDDIEEAKRVLAQMGGDVSKGLQISQLFEAGSELMKNEDFDHAKEKFDQILLLSPDHLGALEKLGLIYLRDASFDPDRAEEVFNKMLRVNPALISPHLQLGFLFEKKGEVEKAISEYQEAVKMDKEGGEIGLKAKKLLAQMGETPEKAAEVFRQMKNGEALVKAGRMEEGRSAYQKILEIVPNHIQALYLLALIDLNQKKISAAEELLRKLLALEPDHVEGHLQLGLILGGRGFYEEAVQELEKVLSLAKEGKEAATARNELIELRKKGEGERLFKAGMEEVKKFEALEKSSPSKPGEPRSGEKSNLLKKGIDEILEAVKLNQDNPYYYYNLGYAYLLKFDLVSAESLFKKAVEKKPDLLIAYYRLALIYDAAGANQAALKDFEKVIELGKPEDEEVKTAKEKIPGLLANISQSEIAKGYTIVGEFLFLEKKEKEKALPLLKKAVEFDPKNGDNWYNLGILYEALLEEEEAAKAYAESIKASPNFSKPYFYLGIIQEKRGQGKEAYENFKKAKQYLVDVKSKEALLIQGRLDFYEKVFSGSFSLSPFNFDSNISDLDPSAGAIPTEVYSTYGLSMKYFYLKSLKLLLSSDLNLSNSVYYYSQGVVNYDSVSFEAKMPDIHGMSIVAGPLFAISMAAGGVSGWSGQLKGDFQETIGWFDALITHVDYIYAISIVNPFYDSVREDVSWTFIKNRFRSGSLTGSFAISDAEIVSGDDSNLSLNGSLTYSRLLIDYLSGSFTLGLGQALFKNPDSSAMAAGLGTVYRKNTNWNLSATLNYPLYSNINLSGTLGYQAVYSNLQAQSSRSESDILTKQTSPLGSYSKYTLGFSINYLF